MELLRSWLNETIGLSRPVVDFEGDLANGYLVGEVLCEHGLLPSMAGLLDRDTPAVKVANLTICQQPLLDLGVRFSSKVANELMTEAKGTAVNLCYQLKLGLENAKDGGGRPVQRRGRSQQVVLGSTVKPTRQLLSKHEAMQAQHFEALVKQQVQDPKQLAQALSLSRYTEHMIQQQQRDEELDQLRAEQYTAMVAQRRQLELSKLHEGSRLMREWQEEGYAKHADNITRRKDDEKAKLRFELSRRSKKAQHLAVASARAAGDLEKGVDEFESTLRRLQSDDADGVGEEDFGAEGAAAMRVEVSAAEHLRKLEKMDERSQKAMAADSKAYLGRLHTRRLEEEAARKEREMRRRKVMLEQDAAQSALEDKRREDLILTKLSRQSEEEKKIGEQLWVARKEKEVMKRNRELRNRQLAEAERLAAIERRERDREMGHAASEEYTARLARERELAAETEAARAAILREKHESTCRTIATELAALAARVIDFRATTQPLLPQKVMRDWMTLFRNGVPLEPPGLDTPHVEEVAEEEVAPAAHEAVNTAELDDYLERAEDWSLVSLTSRAVGEEMEGVLTLDETLSPADAESGCAHTGRMVLDFIEACMPPPPKSEGAKLPAGLIKVSILGRPFAGKSLQAQRLADTKGLQVVMPQQLLEEALAAMVTYDEAAEAARAIDEEAPEGAETSAVDSIVQPPTLALAQAAKAALPGAVPDEVLVGLVVEAIRVVDPVSYHGVVIDGFPRTLAQALALEKALTGFEPPPKDPPKKGSKVAPPPDVPPEEKPPHVPGIDCVLRLDLPDEMARKRALGRKLDPHTGEIYHVEFNPPPEEDEPGLNERLVSVEGAADQEASLPAALVAYADGEAGMAEWFESIGILAPVAAEAAEAEVEAAVDEALAASLVSKEERLAAKKAADDEAAAAAEAAAAEAAAAEAAAAEAAAAEAVEGGEEAAPAPPPAIAAAPAALPMEASEVLYAQWKTLEESFLADGAGALAKVRELQWGAHQRVCSCRKEYFALLTAPDAREQEAVDAQERFNDMPNELRLSDGGKAELHMIAQDLADTLYGLSDARRNAAEKSMTAMSEDGWLGAHALQLTLSVLTLAQAEADRYVKTAAVLHSYCCLRSERALPFAAPPLAELPIPDSVDCSVPLPTDGAPEAAPDPKAKGGKGGPTTPAAAATAESVLLAALTAIVASHCEPIESAEAPPPAEEGATADALRAAEWSAVLHQALVGERAKLRRRLAAVLRYGMGIIGELKGQTGDLYAQLDAWLGDRQRSESAAGSSLVTILRRAVEDEVSLPHALKLQGDALLIDEALLMLPPPPPPPVPKPAQPLISDRFTVAQLEGLATKLSAASVGLMLSAEATSAIFCRLGGAGFDAASPPLPEAWWPLGPPAYDKLTALFVAPDATELAWPEVIFALAPLTPPTEGDIVENLIGAATMLGRAELLGPPELAEGEAAPVVPPRAGLKLNREQYDSLLLWFEAGAEPAADGYSIEAALKALLFEVLSEPSSGTIDIQQLLLYACDTYQKAFATLGFATQAMLTLDGMYELLHREPPPSGIEPPEHLDQFSRAALKRLFVELKLGEAEAAPCPLVLKHPAGARLLGDCPSYVPKDAYGLVTELVQGAGASLKI